jgi:hypothetical protein
MLMRPSTLNSKCIVSGKQQKIEIAPVWDGNRQKVDLLLANFQAYLTDRKNINEKKEKEESRRQQYVVISNNISSTETYKQGSESCIMDEQAKTNYYFLLCKECYWCASSVNLGSSNRIIKCPGCYYACIKLMPIFKNEYD